MPPPKMFILDSNAYFRLAISIHPLLGQKFGKSKTEQYVLRVIAQLDDEYNRSARLQHKFHWVRKSEYKENRVNERLQIGGKQKQQVERARTFILATEEEMGCNLSLVDATALAVGFVKKQPVVTDDKNMLAVANELGIEVWGLLQLLRLMLDEEYIDLPKIKEIACFLDYENDLPYGKSKFKTLFLRFFEVRPFDENAET